jgi:ABC-type transport system substrate-binding protein
VLAVAPSLTGCGGGEPTGTPIGAAIAPGESGALAWALASRPTTFDPLYARTPADELIARQLHEPLVEDLAAPFDEARRLSGLAISVRPSADRTVWRVRLRPGVRFQDGTPFNASAVLDNVDRSRASPRGLEILGDLLVDAPRPDLVRFILPAPDPAFDSRLASPRLGIVSPRAIAAAGGGPIDPAGLPESGTGPFELRERSSDRLLIARNTGWWGSERGLGPGVDQIEFRVVSDPGERLAMLRGGEVQVADLEAGQLGAVRDDPLLAVVPGSAAHGLGIERSVRGIPPGSGTPSLNAVWLTGIDAG